MGYYNFFYYVRYFIKSAIRFVFSSSKRLLIFLLIVLLLFGFISVSKGVYTGVYQSIYDDNVAYQRMIDFATSQWTSGLFLYKIDSLPNDYFIDGVDFSQVSLYYDYSQQSFVFTNNTNQNIFVYNIHFDSNGNYLDSHLEYYSPNQTWVGSNRVSNYLWSNFVLYDENNVIVYPVDYVQNPYLVNSANDINTFNFDYLTISSGTMKYQNEFPQGVNHTAELSLDYIYKGVSTSIDLKNYIKVNDNGTFVINIPYNALTNSVIIKNNENFSYKFNYKLYGTNYNGAFIFNGTYNLTTEQEKDINEENQKQLLDKLESNQQQTNEKLDNIGQQQQQTNQELNNLNDNITNSNVDDSNVDTFGGLSDGFGADDNTGIDALFTILYNAFCNNNIQNVEITIPFVNKSFVLSPTTISSNFPQPVKIIVGVFVWGIVGLWVLKDIRSIIDKISEGSPEDVGSDVKKEVL